jgi:N-acetyl-anhydromuramyl-L-alanine amidase AmpD
MAEMTVPLVSRGNGRWGSPSPAWDHLINRESSGIPNIIQQIHDVNSGGNEAEGLFQITPNTWRRHNGADFAPTARRATPQQQAIVAARIFTRNPSGSDWGAGRPGREDPRQLAAGLVRLDSNQPAQEPAVPDNRPDFNEYPMWSPNNSSRNGKKVDLFLLHTQEGDGNADSLAKFLQGNQVSYHYTISEDYNDHGVTVVDVVDTDNYSWSVLSANARSINLCFAGSRAGWSRDQWLKQSKAIDVAAYIAVQDCKKYGISLNVVAPPYTTTPGISDHQYVTKVLKDGTHTDVGPGFPWDVFATAVAKYANPTTPAQEPPVTQPKQFPHDYSDRELLEYVAAQVGPGDPSWPSKGMTLRDKVWSLVKGTS